MIPTEFAQVEATLSLWMLAMVRPGAAFIVAPIFSAANVPLPLRLVIALAIGLPTITGDHAATLSGATLISFDGFLLVLGESMIGAMIGFAAQLGFAAAAVAGELIGNAMGLGFAAMVDPLGGGPSPIIAHWLTILSTLLFLAMDGHLLLAYAIHQSYIALPPGGGWLSQIDGQRLAMTGSLLFSAGLSIALPVGFAVILVQIVMAVLSRAAPAMNIFAVGFPATLLAGIVLLALALPIMADGIIHALGIGIDQAQAISSGT